MPEPPHGPARDPMAREVERLLAQLSSQHAPTGNDHAPRPPAPRPTTRPRTTRPIRARRRPTPAALWLRVCLGVTLGAAMTQWPYPTGCGLPLYGYLAAVAAVVLTAAWAGLTSWELRRGMAHILSLMLLFWGMVLAAGQVLPRVGYAAERASWSCSAG